MSDRNIINLKLPMRASQKSRIIAIVAAVLLIAVLFVENFCLGFDCVYMGASIFVFVGISYVLRFFSDIFTDMFAGLLAASLGAFAEAIIISIAINSIFDCRFDKNFGTLFFFCYCFCLLFMVIMLMWKERRKEERKNTSVDNG
ncbi:MAG: hypothetical protein J5965_11050 [Aeriscardovia sp.]|nr:hypothetical protein [Aeriscardovia sp.]